MRLLAFHVHTSYSYDCIASPKSIVRFCQEHHIGTVCITDHETIRGSAEAAKLTQGSGVQAIIGAEYHTEVGDIIGLFLKEEIVSHQSMEVIRTIRAQGGISVLPHPYQSHTLNEGLLEAVDIIEVFNSRCDEGQNKQSFELADRLKKPMLAGADAHFAGDINDCLVTFSAEGELTPDNFLSAQRSWSAASTHPIHMRLSQITKAIKIADPSLMYRSVRSFAYTALHELIHSQSKKRTTSRNEWKNTNND